MPTLTATADIADSGVPTDIQTGYVKRIDLNADCGEGYGRWTLGDDNALVPLISSANLACGFHAGDPDLLRSGVALCRQHGVAIGAQPSLPDRQGFGRREMRVDADEVYALVLYQMGAVAAFCRAAGVALHHVKPHGALYNMAAREPALAAAIAAAVRDFDPCLVLYGLAGSALTAAGQAAGLAVAHEAFVDRRYRGDGSLVPRGEAGAVIRQLDAAIAQALAIVELGQVGAIDGSELRVQADTLCIHGDHPGAVDFASRLRAELLARGVEIRSTDPAGERSKPS